MLPNLPQDCCLVKNEIENIQITTPISLYLSRIVILTTNTRSSSTSSSSSSNVIYKTKKLKLAILLHTRQASFLLQQASSLFMPLGNLL